MSQSAIYREFKDMKVALFKCEKCGVDASCNCGAPVVPAFKKAAEAIAANPEKSNRAIAEEIGVGRRTVDRARGGSGGPPENDDRPTIDNPPKGAAPWEDQNDKDDEDDEVEKYVIGKDGKRYPATKKKSADSRRQEKIGRENLRSVLLMNCAASAECAVYKGPVDAEIIAACRQAAKAWSELANNLQENLS